MKIKCDKDCVLGPDITVAQYSSVTVVLDWIHFKMAIAFHDDQDELTVKRKEGP